MLILVQRPQHKTTSDPVEAPKNNPFGAIFIEFGDTKSTPDAVGAPKKINLALFL